MFCEQCGKQISDDARFCGYCGTAVVRKKICPSCGKEMEADMLYCSFCGTKLDGNMKDTIIGKNEKTAKKRFSLRRNK